jgi:hypothetical protein
VDIPDSRAFEILNERKNYLINKKQNKDNGYIKAEISALDKVITFSKYILNNFPPELIKEIVEKSELETKTVEATEDGTEYEVLHSYERDLSKDFKITVSFIRHQEKDQILLVYKKYKRRLFKWAYQGKVRITQTILAEILNTYNETIRS